MSNEPKKDRKIIIDEDWKSQVEQEREQIKTGEEPAPAGETAGADNIGPDQIPEASFALLVTTLATQAMASMGQIPDPASGQPVIHLGLARHYVDTLAVLEEKTKGNLDEEEAAMIDQVLHQLRMLFIAVQNAPEAGE